MNHGRFILTLQCPDAVGIVAAVAGFLAERAFSIEESDQFHDLPHDFFFMRTAFAKRNGGAVDVAELRAAFAPIAQRFAMEWRIHDLAERPRIVVAVSKIGHCLYDLMHREQTGWLGGEIAAIVSNHPDMEPFARWRDKPYHHIPVAPAAKADAEARMLAVMEEAGAELLVLARYMQVLTPDLDEGPIIEQAVSRVAHHHAPKDLVEIGRDVESQVLARAVRWHLERRVVITGNKTVVFA